MAAFRNVQNLRYLKSSITFLFSSMNIFPQSVCTFINIHKLGLNRTRDINFNLFELHETWIKNYSQLNVNNKKPWRCWCSKLSLGTTCLYLFLMISSFFTSRMPLETRTFAILSTRRVLEWVAKTILRWWRELFATWTVWVHCLFKLWPQTVHNIPSMQLNWRVTY